MSKNLSTKLLFIITVILSIVSLFVGVSDISIFNIGKEELDIILISRVPRLISILFAGIGMSISGIIMQQIGKNKFVSPSTAGTIDSAKLGVLIAMVLIPKPSTSQKIVISFIFAALGTLIFMRILKMLKVKDIIFIPLVGIMLGNVVGSIADFIAYKNDLSQNMGSFLRGSFTTIIKGNYEMLYLTIPLLVAAFLYANKFSLIGMGEDISVGLGLNYKLVSNIGVIIVSLISALVVIVIGNIPFLGLVIPNIVSIMKGDNLQKNMPFIAMLGASFLLVCDIISRIIIFPYEIPIEMTVGVIGGAIFLYLIFRRNK